MLISSKPGLSRGGPACCWTVTWLSAMRAARDRIVLMNEGSCSSPTSVRYADRTLSAYDRHAKRAIANWGRARTPSMLLQPFIRTLAPSSLVLDYGCGIGTDLAWMRRRGVRAEGLDGTLAFVLEARRRCPGVPVRHERFETVRLPAHAYDAIWCNAALLHVPPGELRRQLRMLRRALRPEGWLGVTLAWGRARTYTRRDWIPDRYCAGYSKAQGAALFSQWLVRELRVVSNTGRQGRWIWVMARATTPAAS